MKFIYHFSKTTWLLSLSAFLSIYLSKQFNPSEPGIEAIKISFAVSALLLSFIELLSCFSPIPETYDLSLISKSIKPLKKNILTKPKIKKLFSVFNSISNILIYTTSSLYVAFPDNGFLPLLTLGLMPKAIIIFLAAFEPKNDHQDLGTIFPELKK